MPIFYEGCQKVIMVFVDERIATSSNSLRIGKFSAGTNGEDFFWDDFTFKNYFIQVTTESVHLMFPQIANHSKCTADVTVEGAVTNSDFCFVGVTGEGTTKSCGSRCDNARTSVASLDVFFYDAAEGEVEATTICHIGNGSGGKLFFRMLAAMGDGHYCVVSAQDFRKVLGNIFSGFGIVGRGQVNEQYIFCT